jgi:hypothetical protein
LKKTLDRIKRLEREIRILSAKMEKLEIAMMAKMISKKDI